MSDCEVSVIVVNYDTLALTLAAVESVLRENHGQRSLTIHVVDNASPNGDSRRLRQLHAERKWGDAVVLHLNAKNLGFGGGNNVALRQLAKSSSPPRYVFLLNPDARVEGKTIETLAAFLDGRNTAAAAGAAISRPDGTPVSAAFRFPTIGREFVQGVRMGVLSRLLSRAAVSLPPHAGEQEVDWVSGAAVMFSFAALRDVGFFDPDFFLYFEETELMWRLRRAGYAICYVPSARVVHEGGAATGMRRQDTEHPAKPGYWYDSWRLFHVKTQGVSRARMAALACLTGSGFHVAGQSVRGRASKVPTSFFTDFRRHVLQPLFFGDPYVARADAHGLQENPS
jgi:N-acetylglucosaminyl-diphospho-decaprenol L-rhamnosyltransferase